MEVVVVGIEHKRLAEELRRRGVKVAVVPGNALIVYRFGHRSGFQELDGPAAELYISQLVQ